MVNQPNIVFITCHDLGKHLGCYGQETVNSPSLDKFADDGIVFNNSFCTAPQCGPSRAALHTGRFSHANGMLGQMHRPFNWTLHADEKHIAERLRDVGYETVMVGLQHISQQPETLGYDRVFPVEPAHELARTATHQLKQLSQSDKPFYLEIGFVEPHRPFDRPYVESDTSKGVKLPHYAPDTPEALSDFAMLQGIIRVMDEGVGQVLDAIDKHDLRENTWVIFVTDHGIAMPRAKGNLYDAGIETALMMRLPSQSLNRGRHIDALISHVDIVPTILDAIEVPIPENLQGKSFWNLLNGEEYTANTHIFSEKTFHTAYEPMRCIRTTDYKLILNLDVGALVPPADVQGSLFYPQVVRDVMAKRPAIELFNMLNDPHERHNLADDLDYQHIKTDLSARLLDWMEATDDPVLHGAVTSNFQNNALSELRESSQS